MAGDQEGLERVFGRGGALSTLGGRFEHRPGQLRMAQAIAEAIEAQEHLVVEAGTGVGKTLAYLLPILSAGGPVILSTGTKALQEQVLAREVPVALAATGLDRRVEVLKGRENYLCRKRLAEAELRPMLESIEEVGLYSLIRDWDQATQTGDRAEIAELPDGSRLWSRLDARADICTGGQCPAYEECHLVRARRRAQGAHLVVVNHHLLFADRALKLGGFGQVLPEAEVLILDEAHLALEAAAAHFGRRISTRMIVDLARDAEEELLQLTVDPLPARQLGRRGGKLLSALRPPDLAGRMRLRAATDTELESLVDEVQSLYDSVASAVSRGGPRTEERTLIAARCRDQSETLEWLITGADADHVVTVEPQGRRGATLASWPIELGPLLAEALGAGFPSVVATSATLSIGGRLDRAAQNLGLSDAHRRIVASPFDHRRQAALYLPATFPEPGEPRFGERSIEEIRRLLDITQGRALVLFASHRALSRAAEALAGSLPYELLVQGRAPREQLIERFREETSSVLLGTASFRQGIDVPGKALSLVVVDKLPFAVPDDPLVEARAEAIRRRGGNPFLEDQLPEAIIALKQALGRLIRRRDDRGLLALLDVRVRRRRYGRLVLDSLPPWPVVDNLEAARRWYREDS